MIIICLWFVINTEEHYKGRKTQALNAIVSSYVQLLYYLEKHRVIRLYYKTEIKKILRH